jgi:hypothetical protein
MLWRATPTGATLCLERPYTDLREAVALTVEWHHSPDPAVVAAMVRAYERRGRHRRSWLSRVLGRR